MNEETISFFKEQIQALNKNLEMTFALIVACIFVFLLMLVIIFVCVLFGSRSIVHKDFKKPSSTEKATCEKSDERDEGKDSVRDCSPNKPSFPRTEIPPKFNCRVTKEGERASVCEIDVNSPELILGSRSKKQWQEEVKRK